MAGSRARRGRGRLSAIEQLPPECDVIIAWAANQLRDRDVTQQEIYEEFFEKLLALQTEYRGELEFTIPSRSAFNRYSIRLATMTRRLEETREIAASISKRFDAEASDDLTLIAAEAIKTLVWEVLTAAGEHGIDPKGAMDLANALRAATQAQGVSTARRMKVEKEFEQQTEAVIDTVALEAGLSDQALADLRVKLLGLKKVPNGG